MDLKLIVIILLLVIILMLFSSKKSKNNLEKISSNKKENSKVSAAKENDSTNSVTNIAANPVSETISSEQKSPTPVPINQPDFYVQEDFTPPGTPRLDNMDKDPPAIPNGALEAAKQKVPADVPEEVLSQMLLDATPNKVADMITGVDPEILNQTLHADINSTIGEADWDQLNGLGDAVEDLDIWSFGEEEKKQTTA